MKFYTDTGNFQTIKVLAAAKLAGVTFDKADVAHETQVVPYLKESRLPVLEVFPNKFLFSANTIVSYLFSKGDNSFIPDEVYQWLEWESTQFAPVAVPYMISTIGHGRTEKDHLINFNPLLSELDNTLKNRRFLVGNELSCADIVVFGAIFPLQDKLFEGVLDTFPAVKTWMTALQSISPVKEAIAEVMQNKGVAAFKESLLSQPVPHFVHSATKAGTGREAKDQSAKTCTNFSAKTSEVLEEPMERVSVEELEMALKSWKADEKSLLQPLPRKHPVLPVKNKRNILITSALPYVNNVPHLGNIIGCVLSADVFSRYCRLRNYNVLYICGTDEYGTATETKALEENVTPKEICDKYNKIHTEIYKWFNIDFDYFGRTTTQQQTDIAQDIFWRLHKRGFVLKDSLEQLHCVHCDKFLADRFVEGTCPLCGFDDARGDQCDGCGRLINAVELRNPRCKICSKTPSPRVSQHLFLDLPKLEPQLKEHLDKVFSSGVWTPNSRTITNSWIRDGLKPRCISRDLKWGTPVPLEGYTDKVFYVWFDAPIGYISITANYTDQWQQWWKNPDHVEFYNFLGKDNVPFHSVVFPACLLGADDNYTVVTHMIATEYLNYEDTKFSKSRGSGVFGDHAQSTGIPADIYRFYLLYVRPESQDTSFSWDDFLLKNNSELLNNLGNFINRALMFLSNNFDGVVQEMELEEEDKQLLALINRELSTYVTNMENGRLRDSIRNILTISRLGNQFMQANKPWVLVKGTPLEKKRAGSVVSLSVNISCLLSVLLTPYMPETSMTIQSQLNAANNVNIITETFNCRLLPGHTIGKPSPLFQKIDPSVIAELKGKFAGKPLEPKPAASAGKGKPSVTANTPVPSAQGDVKSPVAKADETEIARLNEEVTKQVSRAKADETEIARLNEEVTKQGAVVRDLKAAKAAKSAIDVEVTKLLGLKQQLTLAQGLEPNATPASSGGKKGKKK